MNEMKLPESGFVRLSQIIGDPAGSGPIPVSRSTWYSWVRQGLAPLPKKFGSRISAWRAEDIRALIRDLSDKEGQS